MSKLPAFQFYPADWRKDPGVQSLSYFERGVWFEILCLMHESEQRGKLLLNGKPMPDEALSRLLGLDKQILTKALTVLLDYGVASRDEQGALMSRRMVRDEYIRQVRAESGKKGGNPNLLNQNSTKTKNKVNQNSTPSSSSSDFVTNVTSGKPPDKNSVAKRIWTDGIDLLVADGMKKENAKNFLANLAKNYGESLLAECLAVAQAKNAVDVQTYLIATLKGKKNGNGRKDENLPSPDEVKKQREQFRKTQTAPA